MFLDEVFGTGGPQAKVPRTSTTHHLGLAADHPFVVAARNYYAKQSSGDVKHSRLWLLKLKPQLN